MPISTDDELTGLLSNGRITVLTLDTNIFVEKHLQLKSSSLQAITGLRKQRFAFVLSDTVKREVHKHLEQKASESARAAKKALGAALAAFDITSPTRDEVLAQVTGDQTSDATASNQLDEYFEITNCTILDDKSLVATQTIYDAYFAAQPPFSSGAKKSEFPDALALNALEKFATENDTGVLVASKDGDWLSFCAASRRLYLIPDVERALSLINAPPVVLKEAARAAVLDQGDSREDLKELIATAVGNLEFSVEGYSSAGNMETHAWDAELREIEWPQPEEIDIIDVEPGTDGRHRLTISLPLTLEIEVPVEVTFSAWDSIDRETIGLGSKSLMISRSLEIRATVEVSVDRPGTEKEVLGILSCDLDDTFHVIDLGQVRVFDEDEEYGMNPSLPVRRNTGQGSQ